MFGFNFIELNKKSEKINENYFNRNTRDFCVANKVTSFGNMTNMTANPIELSSIEVNEMHDVTKSISMGKYNYKTDYTIIFLYDYRNDRVSNDLIERYGGKLHNISSSNITILTYFSAFTASRWPNVQHREWIRCNEDNSENIEEMVNSLKEAFNVTESRALIVARKIGETDENYFKVDLSDIDEPDVLFKEFKKVIEVIDDHCEENFLNISREICGEVNAISDENGMQEHNMKAYIKNILGANGTKVTLQDLCNELGISPRTLYNKRIGNTFERDECIYLAFKFRATVVQLNNILSMNDHNTLNLSRRDQEIEDCLRNGYTVEEADDWLRRKKFNGIIPFERIEKRSQRLDDF